MILKSAILVVLIFLLLGLTTIAYLRYYEKKCIYFPVRNVEMTPADAGLKYEDVYFDAEDGIKLNGWFVRSDNAEGSVLFLHGNAGNIGNRIEIIRALNGLGFNIFIFDYRGYGNSLGVPSEKGLYADASAAYHYLAGREDVDLDKLIIYGKSLGANVAADLAARVKAAGLVFDSGFSSARDMGRILFPHLPVKWVISIKFDAAKKIKIVKTPKLIIHSVNDEIIPFELGRKVFEAAAPPKVFYELQGGHNEITFMKSEEYKNIMKEFLRRVMKDG